jgi:hypothetical protein
MLKTLEKIAYKNASDFSVSFSVSSFNVYSSLILKQKIGIRKIEDIRPGIIAFQLLSLAPSADGI